jgi:hypothetical protein
MPEDPLERRGKVPLKSFLSDLRSNSTDQELREKYGLSARGFVSLIKALMAKNVVTAADLEKRREMAVQRDLAKESQFLSGLCICPNCSHPHPRPFEQCPACGASLSEATQQIPLHDMLSTTGSHLYIEEHLLSKAELEPQAPSVRETQLLAVQTDDFPPTELLPVMEDEPSKEEQPPKTAPAPGALGQIKSLFSRLKKK